MEGGRCGIAHLDEAAIKEHVALVKDENLAAGQPGGEAARRVDVLDEPARCGDHEVDSATVLATATADDGRVEALALRHDARAAHDGLDMERGCAVAELLGLDDNLCAELPCTAQDQCTHWVWPACGFCAFRRRRFGAAQKALHSGHEKRKSFARASLCLGQHIASIEAVREHACLNWRQASHACGREGRDELRANARHVQCDHFRLWWSRVALHPASLIPSPPAHPRQHCKHTA